jgi:hypothetical protein
MPIVDIKDLDYAYDGDAALEDGNRNFSITAIDVVQTGKLNPKRRLS